MRQYRKYVHLLVFIVIVYIALQIDDQFFVYNDMPMKNTLPTIRINQMEDDPLYTEIVEKSIAYEEEAEDAYIDQVWKKMPGRNGLKVNVEKSYERMKERDTFQESFLVFEQVKPDVTLKDLPAAPIYRGHPKKQMVALLINVSWGTEHIYPILNTLKEHDVKASFFIEGKWAKENIELVKAIAEQGHLIGNHAYNHPDMARLTAQENTEQIKQTNEILKAITEETVEWFAPPSGSYTEEVVKIAHDMNMQTILWTVDTIDWKNPSVSVMNQRVMRNIHPGAMILMHPTKSVEQGLDALIEEIKEAGYKLDTVERLLSEDR